MGVKEDKNGNRECDSRILEGLLDPWGYSCDRIWYVAKGIL